MVDAPSQRHTARLVRWRIAGLLALASALNYLDRQTLSVLAGTIKAELNLTAEDYSYITSAFLFSYTVLYVVSGRLVDRFGTRRGFAWSVGGWSVATMAHAFVGSMGQLAGVRMLLGVFESANFPAGIRAVAEWFPMRERALGVGIFNAGASVGSAVAVPIISVVALQFGWRWAFVVTGALGLVWLVFWLRDYHPPDQHPSVSPTELNQIQDGVVQPMAEPANSYSVSQLLRIPEAWACIAARVLIDPVTYFLNFWIPIYLQTQQGFDLKTLGYSAWIPYVALALGTVAGGAIPRWLMAQAWSLHRARMTVMAVSSVCIPVCYGLLSQATTPVQAVGYIAGLMFFHGCWSNITLPTELFSKSVQGTLTGLGGTLGGLAGIGTQILIGRTVETFSYTPVFIGAALAYGLAFVIVRLTVRQLGVVVGGGERKD